MFEWELILVAEKGSPRKTKGERKLESTLGRVDNIVKSSKLVLILLLKYKQNKTKQKT